MTYRPGMYFLKISVERSKHDIIVEVLMGCINGDVRIQNNNDIKMNKKELLQWKQYITSMLVLHMMTRTQHEVNYSDRSICGIQMTITGSLSQMPDDTKMVSEVIPIGMKINDARYIEG